MRLRQRLSADGVLIYTKAISSLENNFMNHKKTVPKNMQYTEK